MVSSESKFHFSLALSQVPWETPPALPAEETLAETLAPDPRRISARNASRILSTSSTLPSRYKSIFCRQILQDFSTSSLSFSQVDLSDSEDEDACKAGGGAGSGGGASGPGGSGGAGRSHGPGGALTRGGRSSSEGRLAGGYHSEGEAEDNASMGRKGGRGAGAGVNKKGTPLYSREDIREQYCINDKELQVLDKSQKKSLLGCFSNKGEVRRCKK